MKLASYKDGSRDGQLVVVSRDLSTAHYTSGIASRLQQLLDDWNFISPQLQDLYLTLNQGKARHAFPFDPRQCMAPLPRAYQWAVGSAYLNHVELLCSARQADLPPGLDSEPLMYPGGSDDFLGACDAAPFTSEALGIDFGAGLAVVTGDIPLGCGAERALDGIRLLMLANDWSLRRVVPQERAPVFGAWRSRPASAFSPVAVTPDELGEAWHEGRLHLTLESSWNGRKVGHCEAGPEMTFHFGQLIAHLGKTRRLRAGSIIGSGPVSNRATEFNGKQEWARGFSCIADKRAMETLIDGKPATDYLQYGDVIRIEMKGRDGQSVFGAIEQTVAPAQPA